MSVIERQLKLDVGGDKSITVPVRIFSPYLDGGSWFCKWEIQWPDRLFSIDAGGVDAVQALLHAMQMVGAALYCSEEHKSGHLSWTEGHKGYGFPVTNSIRDLLEGDDAEFL